MDKILPVSIVLPCISYDADVRRVVRALFDGSSLPRELIVVASGCSEVERDQISLLLMQAEDASGTRIKLVAYRERLYPGAARNKGIEFSSMNWIAFLDVKTIPSSGWLNYAWNQTIESETGIVYGSTRYVGRKLWSSCIISATYGFLPLKTVPGTLIERKDLEKVGYFIPQVKAGEDTDWMNRIGLIGLKGKLTPANSLMYSSVPSTPYALILKWFNNYRSCAPMVHHLERQKIAYISALYTVLLLFAFNWNGRVASWNTESTLYVANITKAVAYSCLASYVVIRSLVMPIRRGVPLWWILPFRWLYVGLLCIVLDSTKVIAFAGAAIRIRR